MGIWLLSNKLIQDSLKSNKVKCFDQVEREHPWKIEQLALTPTSIGFRPHSKSNPFVYFDRCLYRLKKNPNLWWNKCISLAIHLLAAIEIMFMCACGRDGHGNTADCTKTAICRTKYVNLIVTFKCEQMLSCWAIDTRSRLSSGSEMVLCLRRCNKEQSYFTLRCGMNWKQRMPWLKWG